jgi:hypothetical protein
MTRAWPHTTLACFNHPPTSQPTTNQTHTQQGKADEWRRSWALKPSMAIELYLQLASLLKV